MALLKGKPVDLPADAIILTRDEAQKYQAKIINNWKHSGDVFFYKYGIVVLGAASAFSGMYLNSYYRLKLKLHSYGRASSYLPIVLVPAAMSALLHQQLVVSDVLLQDSCPTCLEVRASSIQTAVGGLLPSFLAPISALALATQYCTYNVPYISKEPRKLFMLWKNLTHPISNILYAIFIGQALLASGITYLEARSVSTVNRKLAQLEYDLQNGL